jgi:transposase
MPQRDIFIVFSPEEMNHLKEIMRQLAISGKIHIRRRGNALLMSHNGKTVPQIACDLGCSKWTIYNWLGDYRRNGFKALEPANYSRKLDDNQLQQLIKVSGWSAFFTNRKLYCARWTFCRMAEWVEKNWGVKLSPRRFCQMFKELRQSGKFPYDKPNKKTK